MKGMLEAVGALWRAGVEIKWGAVQGQGGRRVPLPTYPFERQRYWIDPPRSSARQDGQTAIDMRIESTPPEPAAPEPALNDTNAMNGQRPQQQTPVFRHPRPLLHSKYVAPMTATEHAVAEIWQEVLGIEHVGTHDDFIELGGDSLVATQVISRLRAMFTQNIPLATLLENPTVARLAAYIATRQLPTAEPQVEADEDDIERILRQIEDLSPEELAAELARTQSGAQPSGASLPG
jgi:acyl transferase domain-containing protein